MSEASDPVSDHASKSDIHHGTFTFRFAGPEDLDRIITFYKDNPHFAVYIREREVWADRINQGLFQIIEDPDGNLMGATSCYAHPQVAPSENDPANVYNEVGSTLAPRSLPGKVDKNRIGTYELMIAIQSLRIFEQEVPSGFVMANVQTGIPGVLERLGGPILRWQEFVPEAKLVEWFKASVDKGAENVANEKKWLMQPVNVLPAVAEWLVGMAENPEVEMVRGGRLIRRIDMESTLAMARDIVTHRAYFETQPDEVSWAAVKAGFDKLCLAAAKTEVGGRTTPVQPDLGIVEALDRGYVTGVPSEPGTPSPMAAAPGEFGL